VTLYRLDTKERKKSKPPHPWETNYQFLMKNLPSKSGVLPGKKEERLGGSSGRILCKKKVGSSVTDSGFAKLEKRKKTTRHPIFDHVLSSSTWGFTSSLSDLVFLSWALAKTFFEIWVSFVIVCRPSCPLTFLRRPQKLFERGPGF